MSDRTLNRLLKETSPFAVGIASAVYGLSSLLLIAAHADNIPYTVLHPGFWLGDGLALPATLATIASYYHNKTAASGRLSAAMGAASATVYTVAQACYTEIVSGNYEPVWSFAHSLFIWMLVYAVTHFTCTVVARFRLGEPLPVELWLVASGIITHLLLALIFGPKVSARL